MLGGEWCRWEGARGVRAWRAARAVRRERAFRARGAWGEGLGADASPLSFAEPRVGFLLHAARAAECERGCFTRESQGLHLEGASGEAATGVSALERHLVRPDSYTLLLPTPPLATTRARLQTQRPDPSPRAERTPARVPRTARTTRPLASSALAPRSNPTTRVPPITAPKLPPQPTAAMSGRIARRR